MPSIRLVMKVRNRLTADDRLETLRRLSLQPRRRGAAGRTLDLSRTAAPTSAHGRPYPWRRARSRRSGGRRRRPQVSYRITDSGIDFMTDSRNHRHSATGHGAGDPFVVERPQVVLTATASADNEHVGLAPATDSSNGGS